MTLCQTTKDETKSEEIKSTIKEVKTNKPKDLIAFQPKSSKRTRMN